MLSTDNKIENKGVKMSYIICYDIGTKHKINSDNIIELINDLVIISLLKF